MRNLYLFFFLFLLISCTKNNNEEPVVNQDNYRKIVAERIKAYAKIKVDADLSGLNEREKMLLKILSEAGQIADEIFWRQSAHDAIAVRDSLNQINKPEDELIREYVKINYGPYDVIHGNERFLPGEPKVRFPGAAFYPKDLTREEFEEFIKKFPEEKESLTSSYTVVIRQAGVLKAVPYGKYYDLVEKLAQKLEEAANYADDLALKKYLLLRANAIRTDDYYESDMAWMDVKGKIDVVIGPIETYQDALFGYKAAYEAVVMVKDEEATKEFETFKSLVSYFELNLPIDNKYKRKKFNSETELNIVNVVYFGGDCQKGTKTIAASLPNDPRVRNARGGKNSMYKNMMEAKFQAILVPISKIILPEEYHNYVDQKAFTSFVTLHEFSHTLGPGYVFGKNNLEVRTALRERYSPIEECKADIVSMWNHKLLLERGIYDENYIKKAQITYLAGLFRSIRFGTESAHARANLIQLNYLKENGAIKINSKGKYELDYDKFWEAVKSLANKVLTIEATGNYDEAGQFIEKYAKMTDEVNKAIDKLKNVPRDIDSYYVF